MVFTFKGKYFGFFCLKCKLWLLQGYAFWGILEEAEAGAAPPGHALCQGRMHLQVPFTRWGWEQEGRTAQWEKTTSIMGFCPLNLDFY